MSVQLFGNHKGIADRILHQNIVCIFFIPKLFPAGDRFLHHRPVIENAHSSPAVRDGVLIFGIKPSGLLKVLSTDIFFRVGDVLIIDFRKHPVLNHAAYHIVGRAGDIVSHSPGFHLWIHTLVCLKLIIDDLDAVLLLKHEECFGINVLPPIVDNDLAVYAFVGGTAAQGGGKENGQRGSGLSDIIHSVLFHGELPFFSL